MLTSWKIATILHTSCLLRDDVVSASCAWAIFWPVVVPSFGALAVIYGISKSVEWLFKKLIFPQNPLDKKIEKIKAMRESNDRIAEQIKKLEADIKVLESAGVKIGKETDDIVRSLRAKSEGN
jgi:hypothetical protein